MSDVNATTNTKTVDGCEYSNPIKALGHMFRHLFDFSGRATRKEFNMSVIGFASIWCASLGVGIASGIADELILYWFVGVPCLTSLMMRRYHDFGYNGDIVVLAMLAFPLWMFSMPLLVLECMLHSSQKGCNQYGMSSSPLPITDGQSVAMLPVHNSLGIGCLTMIVSVVGFWFLFNLPLFFPTFVPHVQYDAHVLPQIWDVRTKIGHYQSEHGRLSGVGAVCVDGDGLSVSPVQTFVRDRGVTNEIYVIAYCAADYQTVIPIRDADSSQPQMRHFADDINLKPFDLLDDRCKPAGYRYWATMASSNSYAYCVGYFPSEECQIKSGTGYAVLEIARKHIRQKATWERYKAIDDARIVLRPATNATETAQSAGDGTCWLGHPDLYLSDDSKKIEQGIQELKEAGWSFGDK